MCTGHSACPRCGHVVRREEFFKKKKVVRVLQPPPPPKGFETYINSIFKTSMARPRWGPTSNNGRELTWRCYALKQKYHLPCPPPPCCKFFVPTYIPQSEARCGGHFKPYMLGSGCPPPLQLDQDPPPPPRPLAPPRNWLKSASVWPIAMPPLPRAPMQCGCPNLG